MDLREIIIGLDSTCKQIHHGLQVAYIGIQIDQLVKTHWENICRKLWRQGIEDHFRNHSLRKATATRLFEKGVDPQLIQEQTGHKSSAVMLYKKSNIEMKRKVSDMLNVLQQEMQQIRDREVAMLENESKKEKKKFQTPMMRVK